MGGTVRWVQSLQLGSVDWILFCFFFFLVCLLEANVTLKYKKIFNKPDGLLQKCFVNILSL